MSKCKDGAAVEAMTLLANFNTSRKRLLAIRDDEAVDEKTKEDATGLINLITLMIEGVKKIVL